MFVFFSITLFISVLGSPSSCANVDDFVAGETQQDLKLWYKTEAKQWVRLILHQAIATPLIKQLAVYERNKI